MMFPASDARIRFIGRWGAAGPDGQRIATATGSRFECRFSGDWAVLHFDVLMGQRPLPHAWIQVDDGARIEVGLDRWIRIAAHGDGPHTLRVILKSMVEMFPRWHLPLANKMGLRRGQSVLTKA